MKLYTNYMCTYNKGDVGVCVCWCMTIVRFHMCLLSLHAVLDFLSVNHSLLSYNDDDKS